MQQDQKVLKVAISWSKDIESLLTNWESLLIWKFDQRGKLFDEESCLTRKVDGWEKLMNLGFGD